MAKTYDAVVVGGRCAGAALATYLARDGLSVALLEADPPGSDQVLSTHTIHPPGMDVLDDLGVGEAIRSHSPPARTLRLYVDGSFIDVTPPADRHECCPRRYRLDRLLQEAARATGAELSHRTRVTGLLRDGERVAGVRAECDGSTLEVKGRLVVGADGRHSTIARLVEAEEYLGYDWPRVAYWAYWEPPAVWQTDAYPYDFLLDFVGIHRRLIFATDEGQILLGTMPTIETARLWPADHEAHYLADLRSDPQLEPLVDGGELTGKVVGTVKERFFFRRSAGPGWALVGDAGHHKDPLIGWGIAEALVQARNLAAAVKKGSDAELVRYWRQRDVDALPRFRFAEMRGEATPINPIIPVALEHVPSVPGLAQHLFKEAEYDVNPFDLMPVSKVASWTLGAALRGRPRLIADFLRMGSQARRVQREVVALRRRVPPA